MNSSKLIAILQEYEKQYGEGIKIYFNAGTEYVDVPLENFDIIEWKIMELEASPPSCNLKGLKFSPPLTWLRED